MGVDYHASIGYGFEVTGPSEKLYDLLEGVDDENVDAIYAGFSGDCTFALVIRDSVTTTGFNMDCVDGDYAGPCSDATLHEAAERLGLKPKHPPRWVIAGYLSC